MSIFSVRVGVLVGLFALASTAVAETNKGLVPNDHPRLLGSRARLQRLARDRADAYQRIARVAWQQKADAHSKMISMALVCTIEQDRELGRQVIAMAMKTINGPVKRGHVPFAHNLARCAIVYDFCHEYWTRSSWDEDATYFFFKCGDRFTAHQHLQLTHE